MGFEFEQGLDNVVSIKVIGVGGGGGNVYGTQFHPEKSGEVGLQILKAFCEL